MYLRRLELVGFKTFADRTELVFGPGITAIVGPNGSGKSNLADAVRWVLGETSWRALRTQRTEDVIFAGTSTRRPHGMAEVHLTVDNEDGALPVEFTEVTVTRRATRAGDSEFLINRVPCRLRDIQALFLGTGLGGRAYAMIGQGEVEAVLDASPAERRALLEEAAGLSRYKRRQAEAARRLEHARGLLARVADRLVELEQRARELAQQAERARMYRDYQERLRRAELALVLEEYRRVRAHLRRVSSQLQSAQQKRAQLQAAAGAVEEELAQVRARAQQAFQALQAVQAELVRAVEEAGRAEQEARLAEQRAASAVHLRDRVRDELARVEGEQEELRRSVARLREEVEVQQAGVEGSARQLEQLEAEVQAAEQALRDARDAVEAARAEVVELEHARTQAEATRAALQARREGLSAQERAAAAHVDRLAAERRELEEAQGALRARLEDLDEHVHARSQEVAALRAHLQALSERRAELEQASRELQLRRESCRARLAVLEEAQAQLLGYEVGARRVLLAQRQQPGSFAGVRGALVDFLDVDREHRAAVEAALQDRLYALVVDSWQSVHAVLAAVDSESTSFLVTEGGLQASGDGPALPRGCDGVVGPAADLVRCPPLVHPLVQAALRQTVVVHDLQAALRLRSAGWRGRLVTLSGELLTDDGLLVVRRNGSAGPLGRLQEISTLREELADLQRSEQALARQLQEVQAEEASLRGRLEEGATSLERLQAQVHGVREELARVDTRLARHPALEDHARRELELVRQQLREVEEEDRRWGTDAGQLARALGEARRALEVAHKRHQQADSALQAASASLQAARVEHAERLARWEAARARLAELEGEQAAGEARAASLRHELEAAQAEVLRLQAEAGQAAQTALQAALRVDELKRSAQRASQARAEEERAVADLEPRLVAARADLHAAEEEAHRLELRAAQVAAELAAVDRRIRDSGADPEALDRELADRLDRDALLGEVESLRGLLAHLGPVNAQALDEYREVQARYGALRAQAEDTEQAADLLAQLAARLEAVLRRRFGEAFQEVNGHFQDCFRRLFGGGRAWLERVTGEDGEEGVEIVAQPPGKKVRSLGALSGGERVMVALAVVFALLRTHPSPFCVFDEIEAALDDANTRRVVELLRELAGRSQVVIITHNKATMEAADVLYGVTTQEPGVSSVVSVRIARPSPEPAGVR